MLESRMNLFQTAQSQKGAAAPTKSTRGTDLSGYTQTDLDKVALRLNERPRKTLGFQTPASKLQQSVASTV
jgi:hypothetical protein